MRGDKDVRTVAMKSHHATSFAVRVPRHEPFDPHGGELSFATHRFKACERVNAYAAIFVAQGCLLGALPSILLFGSLRKLAPREQTCIVCASALVALAVPASIASGIRFTSVALNTIGLAFGYVAVLLHGSVVLADSEQAGKAHGPRDRGDPDRLDNPGNCRVLAVAFVVGDYADPPEKTEHIAANLECEVTGWGMVASGEGYTVHLYRTWPLLPLVEKEIARVSVDETNPAEEGTQSATCNTVLAATAH